MLGSSPDSALHLLALSGDRQIGTPGQLLPEPIVARLTDAAGNGVAHRSLVFDAYHGGSRLIDASGGERVRLVLRTDARGDATVGVRLSPDTDANLLVVRVRAAGAVRPATFSFRGKPVAPAPSNLLAKPSNKE